MPVPDNFLRRSAAGPAGPKCARLLEPNRDGAVVRPGVSSGRLSRAFALFETDSVTQFLLVDPNAGVLIGQLLHQISYSIGNCVQLLLDRVIGAFLGVL